MFLSLPGQRGQRGKMALRIRHPRLLILALAFALPLSPGASISGQCSSYTSCQACYDPSSSPLPSSPTDSCRWCAGKCYDPDDVQCALGETCAPPPPTAGSCSQIASCDQCAVQSGCNWCGDGKCALELLRLVAINRFSPVLHIRCVSALESLARRASPSLPLRPTARAWRHLEARGGGARSLPRRRRRVRGGACPSALHRPSLGRVGRGDFWVFGASKTAGRI